MKILPLLTRQKHRFQSLVKRKLNKRQLNRLREYFFRRIHVLRGLPGIRPDLCAAIENNQLLINCRLLDPKSHTQAIGLQYNDGKLQLIGNDLVHYRTSPTSLSKTLLSPNQPDRFCGLISCNQPPQHIQSLVLKLNNGKQKKVSLHVETVPSEPLPLIARLLELIPRDSIEKRRAFDDSLGAMIHALWDTREKTEPSSRLIRYNQLEQTTCPQVSIIIPIYGRYDFIEYQLAQFANDEFMHEQEIIYVIDDPRICEQVKTSCESLARIYRIPFKLLLLEKNLGYAGANNTGVSHASGENVLLLNSDVFPQSHGWLEQLLASVDYDMSDVLLGARLNYHDESIQHNGMSFFSSPFAGGLWINMHPGKGLPADQFSRSTRPQIKESITGACLLISKDNYETLGGLDDSFILGDFEDSDLCMKAREKGFRILLSEQVCLYHLERQSQSLVSGSRWKNELTYYNCWYHTHKWHSQITQLKKDMSSEHLH